MRVLYAAPTMIQGVLFWVAQKSILADIGALLLPGNCAREGGNVDGCGRVVLKPSRQTGGEEPSFFYCSYLKFCCGCARVVAASREMTSSS